MSEETKKALICKLYDTYLDLWEENVPCVFNTSDTEIVKGAAYTEGALDMLQNIICVIKGWDDRE